MNYLSKTSVEIIPLEVDFIDVLLSGELVSTASLSVHLIKGHDTNYTQIIPIAAPTIVNGRFVHSTVLNGVVDCIYQIDCTVTSSLGNVYKITTTVEIFDHTTARQEFADYCLRKLGGGVVNIEVSDEQVNDSINDAIQYFHEYHFDGIERDYLIYKIQGTTLTVADGSIFSAGDTVISDDDRTTALIASVAGNVLTINRQIGYDKFAVGATVKSRMTQQSTTISAITLGDPDLGYIPAGDEIVGVKRILNITSILGSADYMFNVQYQIMMSEIQNITSQGTAYFYGVQQYLGHLDFIMKKEKDFRFNRRMNRLYLDVSWGNDVKVGDIVIAEVYHALSEELYPEIYQDIWLRRYTTALIKKMWGNNLRKYSGMPLPGGVSFNGQQIYNEAMDEIKDLEAEAIYSTSPLEFMVG